MLLILFSHGGYGGGDPAGWGAQVNGYLTSSGNLEKREEGPFGKRGLSRERERERRRGIGSVGGKTFVTTNRDIFFLILFL